MFTPARVAQTVESIANQLEAVVPQISVAAGVGGGAQATVTTITEVLNDVKRTAAALATAEEAGGAMPLVTRITNDLSQVLATMASLPLPPQAAMTMRIAQMLVPTIGAAAMLVWPPKLAGAS